jgi:hypothetical protein
VAVIDGTVKKAEPLIMDADKKRKGTIKDIGKYIYWDFEGLWVGHFEEFPEHWSQGETIAELREGLLKIHDLLMRGELQRK